MNYCIRNAVMAICCLWQNKQKGILSCISNRDAAQSFSILIFCHNNHDKYECSYHAACYHSCEEGNHIFFSIRSTVLHVYPHILHLRLRLISLFNRSRVSTTILSPPHFGHLLALNNRHLVPLHPQFLQSYLYCAGYVLNTTPRYLYKGLLHLGHKIFVT